MKSVLISIQPYWVFLIIAKKMGWNINQEKTVEVRKNYPKSNDWNKVVKIYCTKDKKSFAKIPKEYQPLMERLLGKVIGEFVCDGIIVDKTFGHDTLFNACSCMNDAEIASYCTNNKMYGWHISDLAIYDKPRELGEFHVIKKCVACKWTGYESTACIYDKDCKVPFKITRPPQSWCYVESEVEGG